MLAETRPPVGEQSPKPAKALALHVDPCSGEVLSTEACTAAHPTYLEVCARALYLWLLPVCDVLQPCATCPDTCKLQWQKCEALIFADA